VRSIGARRSGCNVPFSAARNILVGNIPLTAGSAAHEDVAVLYREDPRGKVRPSTDALERFGAGHVHPSSNPFEPQPTALTCRSMRDRGRGRFDSCPRPPQPQTARFLNSATSADNFGTLELRPLSRVIQLVLDYGAE
jgi:hypothetical protein